MSEVTLYHVESKDGENLHAVIDILEEARHVAEEYKAVIRAANYVYTDTEDEILADYTEENEP